MILIKDRIKKYEKLKMLDVKKSTAKHLFKYPLRTLYQSRLLKVEVQEKKGRNIEQQFYHLFFKMHDDLFLHT